MTEFPELEKVSPRGIRKWAAKVRAWANAKRLVTGKDSGIKLQEFATGTLISLDLTTAGTGGGITTRQYYVVINGALYQDTFVVTGSAPTAV